ncbi:MULTISPECIES: hypothetical protein [Photorhabdus]|uniref:hypothetical protein n=1 Tax=Photorhabdus TaxID=29487 RepID=UPI0007B46F7F|nr:MULTISPECIES: hypothetical protein [Photorhabdus]AXG42214.1 hypothetical protein PluDJC_08095 [Photorhabdus laumondii subsp. laumondii]MCC8387686.1 hypothetical protein [Photorhabdus laumondii]MCZ1247936.1 hypothetical protein [Photorhabdus laumondii subsp. laumondii]NDL15043.1 hypothetical protein [Photorhabdus laumondii subsp. laumondii]NDL47239.1 hypothetical protein [Photorhabdus laumondii subsp. laumondii]
MINLIQRYWLIVVWGSLCIWLGDRWAESRLQPQINQEIENRQEAELSFYRAQKATAELNAGALHDLIEKQQAQQHANEKMSNDLYAAITRLSQATQRIEQSIPDALSRDGSAYTGIGPDGLRLYQTALGYHHAAPGDFSLPGHSARSAATAAETADAAFRGTTGAVDPRQPVRAVEPGTGAKAAGNQSPGRQTTGKTK